MLSELGKDSFSFDSETEPETERKLGSSEGRIKLILGSMFLEMQKC